MQHRSRLRWFAAAATVAFFSMGSSFSCAEHGIGSILMFFRAPLLAQLSLPDSVEVDLRVSALVDEDSVVVQLDDMVLDPTSFTDTGDGIATTLMNQPEGPHSLRADAEIPFLFWSIPVHAATLFEIADLARADECEILNDTECLLPYPSSRFLADVGAATATGVRVNFPEFDIPGVNGPPLDPTPTNLLDGFAPTVQILMNFPQGVDLAASDAPVLLAPDCCGQSHATPYVDIRTQDGRSTEPHSPTVLLDADTGERILHWVELDSDPAALADPTRQVLFLRPGKSLVPGHRYIVAVRKLVDPDGAPVKPEPAFRALRDGHPSTIPALEARRDHFDELFWILEHASVKRRNLQLAFDFTVRSDEQLTGQMLSMRDESYQFLEGIAADDVSGFDNIVIRQQSDCSNPTDIWRRVHGTFQGPYYLTADLDHFNQLTLLNVDADQKPVQNGTHTFNWDIAVPCSVFLEQEVGHPLLLGHGFLGDGAGMVESFGSGTGLLAEADVAYVAGATDWRGLALGVTGPDALFILANVIGSPAAHKFNNFSGLPARLMQGQLNTLVLSRMMRSGFFNRLPEFQRVSSDPSTGVFDTEAEMFYFGVSLGGIYGTFNAALNPDIVKYNIDVPAMNFALLEQRSTQFPLFLQLLKVLGLEDPMSLVLLLGIQHELWVQAEPAGYVRHITGSVDAPLPGVPPKELLMTVSWLDKQVSNQASEIMARSLGIPSLEGSLQAGLQEIPDVADGPDGLSSALVIYDTGYFDIFDPAYDPFLPPLANQIPSSKCDPHGLPRLFIPASVDQLTAFLQPGGAIFNFCDGVCDAQSPNEVPPSPCDPLAP